MCFSVQVDQDIKRLAKTYSASVDVEAYSRFGELASLEQKIGQKLLLDRLGMSSARKRKAAVIKVPAKDGIVYSNYFTNIITKTDDGLTIEPMRYRVRPAGSREEIPSKYNVFNARYDSLLQRKTWKNIFAKNHGIIILNKFNEWVLREGKKKMVSFSPKYSEVMSVPCVWDEWQSEDKTIQFKSFAIITNDPPKDVLDKGHDRCPIYLGEEHMDHWLTEGKSKQEYLNLLTNLESDRYLCSE